MQYWSVEQIVWSEGIRFPKKDITKWKAVGNLYAASLLGSETGKLTRASYFFMRHLDDLLDGEMTDKDVNTQILDHPVAYTRSLREQVVTGKYDSSIRIARLAEYAIPRLER